MDVINIANKLYFTYSKWDKEILDALDMKKNSLCKNLKKQYYYLDDKNIQSIVLAIYLTVFF